MICMRGYSPGKVLKSACSVFVSLANRPLRVRQTAESILKLLNLGYSLNLDADDCKAMNEIFKYTEQKAPYLLGRVKELSHSIH